MKALLLSMEAPMRSWGTLSLGDDRGTLMHPSASGAIGFLAACVGIDRNDRQGLERWFGTWDVASVSPHAPLLLVDYQTASNSREVGGGIKSDPVVSRRSYLLSPLEVFAFFQKDGGSDLVEVAAAALEQPVFTPYAGRRSCPLMAPPRHVVVDVESADDIARLLMERWASECEARGDSPIDAVLMMSAGLVAQVPGNARRYTRFIANERSTWMQTYGTAPKDFFLLRSPAQEKAA
jgi:CRISPR system Cascade subunit CasD